MARWERSHRATVRRYPVRYLAQFAMSHISESQPLSSTFFMDLETPEVAEVRLMSGMITTSETRMSLA